MPAPFACRAPAWAGGLNLCYQGGSCADGSNATSSTSPVGVPCAGCAAGWTGDFLLLHNANCAMPTSLYVVLFGINTPILAVTAAACALGAFGARRARLERDVWLALVATAALLWVVFLGDLAQDGMYEVGAVGFAGTLLGVGVARSMTVAVQLAAAGDAARRAFGDADVATELDAVRGASDRVLRIAYPALVAMHVAAGAGMIATCRGDPLDGVFNAWTIALMWSDAAAVLVLEGAHARSLTRALRALARLQPPKEPDAVAGASGGFLAQRLAALVHELRTSRMGAATAVVAAGANTFGVALYAVLGSVPWLWPSILILVLAVYGAVGTTAVVLRQRARDRARDEQRGDQSVVDVAPLAASPSTSSSAARSAPAAWA